MESVEVVVKKKLSLKIIESFVASETKILQKVMRSVKFCQKFWKKSFPSSYAETFIVQKGKLILTNFNDYARQTLPKLNFKDEKYDWRCSNCAFRRAKSLHCAENKTFAYGTWMFFKEL